MRNLLIQDVAQPPFEQGEDYRPKSAVEAK